MSCHIKISKRLASSCLLLTVTGVPVQNHCYWSITFLLDAFTFMLTSLASALHIHIIQADDCQIVIFSGIVANFFCQIMRQDMTLPTAPIYLYLSESFPCMCVRSRRDELTKRTDF